jgi:ribosome maturation factor RimP
MPAKERVVDAVAAVTAPLAESLGLEFVDAEYRKEGGRWFLRVFIDKPEGVGLEDCEALSELLGRVLDEKDLIPHAYTLEVSSPGVERPLKKPADFKRFAGREVRIVTAAPLNGRRKFTGSITSAGEDAVFLLVDGVEVSIPYAAISRANLVFNW